MAVSAVTASWALAQTATDLVSISIAACEAATTDNIQLVALLAAEGFGTTLPMCQQSKSKVYQLCSRDQQSAITNFFKAKIGYRKGDSGWQLCQSDPGCRFLALAVCLLTINHWQAAEILRECIEETAENKRLVPTSQQLKQLLHALQDRLAHAGFLNSVLEWNWLLLAKDQAFVTLGHSWRAPPPPIIAKLIKGISQIARLGESYENSHVQLHIGVEETAWMIAFVRWCLGSSPTVILEEDRTFLDQPNSKVIIIVGQVKKMGHRHDVCVVHAIDEVTDLISHLGETSESRIQLSIKGMTSTHNFCEAWRRRHFDEVEDLLFRQILPYTCHLTVTKMVIESPDWLSDLVEHQQLKGLFQSESIERLDEDQNSTIPRGTPSLGRIRVFSDEAAISRAMRKFLGVESDKFLELEPSPCHRVVNLPPMKSYHDFVSPGCRCTRNKSRGGAPVKLCSPLSTCLHKIMETVAIILLISLLESFDDDEILVSMNITNIPEGLKSAIKTCIDCETRGRCNFSHISSAVLLLLGHKVPKQGVQAWVMSSNKGQTISPKIFENLEIPESGGLRFRCVPGSIYWKEQRFEYALQKHKPVTLEDDTSPVRDLGSDKGISALETPPLYLPQDDYPGFSLEWSVHALGNNLSISVTAPSLPGRPNRRPMDAIRSLLMSHILSCPHDKKTPFSEHMAELLRGTIVKPLAKSRRQDRRAIIMCADNIPARFFALTSPGKFIIRGNACLNCCVKVSRAPNNPYPVLC